MQCSDVCMYVSLWRRNRGKENLTTANVALKREREERGERKGYFVLQTTNLFVVVLWWAVKQYNGLSTTASWKSRASWL